MDQYKEFLIERETKSAFTVRGGATVIKLDMNDRETAKKQIIDNFGMIAIKAERIIDKAQKQSVTNNLFKKAREKVNQVSDIIKNKKIDRRSRT